MQFAPRCCAIRLQILSQPRFPCARNFVGTIQLRSPKPSNTLLCKLDNFCLGSPRFRVPTSNNSCNELLTSVFETLAMPRYNADSLEEEQAYWRHLVDGDHRCHGAICRKFVFHDDQGRVLVSSCRLSRDDENEIEEYYQADGTEVDRTRTAV